MTFLNPWAWLAALLAIPIVLLYLLRLQQTRVRVPSLLLWEAVLADRHANRPWQRLRRNWLLFVQLLALFALVAALARPALPAPLTVQGRLIVLLDASASMQASADGVTRFALAQRALRSLGDSFTAQARIALILVDAQPRLVLRDADGQAFRRALERLEPGAGPADWQAAAALAAGLATTPDTTTLIVTDAALHAPLPDLPGTVRLLTVGADTPNVGIVALALRRSAQGQQAFVRLRNAGPTTQRTLTLYVDGAFWEQRPLTLEADGALSLTFDALPALTWLEARLSPADAFPLDDRAWVAEQPAQGGKVLLVTPDNPFLLRALRLLPGALRVDVSPTLDAAQGETYDLIVTDGPITGTLPAAVNVWALAPRMPTPCGSAGAPYTVTGTLRGQWTHPLLAHVDWRDVYIARAYAYTLPPEATVLVESSEGPLLWTVEAGGRRVACLGFDVRDSDLPLQVAFPILTANLVGWLLPQASTEPVLPMPAGLPWADVLPADARATLILPDGARMDWPPATFPTAPGLYRLELETGAVRYVALSLLDADESDLRPQPLRVGTRPLAPLQENSGWREVGRYPLALALLLILLEALLWWGRAPRLDAALLWRAVIVLSLVLALLGARWTRPTRDLTIVYLLDRSASTRAAWDQAVAVVDEVLARKAPRDEIGIVVFGREASVDRLPDVARRWAAIATRPPMDATNIEAAIRLGMALIPDDRPGRLVLLSDGLETIGRAEAVLPALRARGLDWQVWPLPGGLTAPEVWVEALRVSTYAYVGDRVTAQVSIGATASTPLRLTWSTPDAVGEAEVELIGTGGSYVFSFTAAQPGVMPLRVCLTAPADTFTQNNCADVWLWVQGAPRVLVVGEETERAALVAALRQAGLELETATPAEMPISAAGLSAYAAVVLVNTPARAFDPQALRALQAYVRDLGGGLVTIGGPQSYGVGGWLGTPLEEVLPVLMQVRDPDRFPPLAMVIVIDKSGSMGAVEAGTTKIQLAAEGAARAAEALNDNDTLAVIAYDDRPADVLGPVSMRERASLIAQVLRLQPGGGGIYVRESLLYAYELLQTVPAVPGLQRHILLLADGSDAERQEGVEAWIDQVLAPAGVTLSVVAIGDGPDVPFLRRCADRGGGRFYLTTRAVELPAIFAAETQQAKRSYIVEREFYPQPVSTWAPVQDVRSTPPLLGYVATTPKPTAQVVWDAVSGDPLLAAWSYGLGRAVAWTSDATGRWAAPWVSWRNASAVWGPLVRWVLPPPSDPGLSVRVVPEENAPGRAGLWLRVELDAFTAEGDYASDLALDLAVAYPQSARAPITATLEGIAPGRYRAYVPAEPGVVVLRLTGARTLTTGWAPPISAEFLPAPQSAEQATARLAALGGGIVISAPEQTLAHTLRGVTRSAPLSLPLIVIALLLWPLDIAWRRLALSFGLIGRWAHRFSVGGRWPQVKKQQEKEGPPASLAARLKRRRGSSVSQIAMRGRPLGETPSPPREEAPPPAAAPTPPSAGEGTGETLAARLKKRMRG